MQGQLEPAYEILAAVESPAAAYGVRARGLTRRAVLADRLGRRDEALRLYGLAADHLATRPEFNVFDALHRRIAAGLEAPQTEGDLSEGPELMLIPH